MGFLGVARSTPFALFGLFAGVWADRLRRRPILIGADLGRALLLATIPASAIIGVFRIELLYIVMFLVGTLHVFFDVAYTAYLPSLVPRDALVEGNGKLEVSRAVAQIGGPGLGGALVQLLTAPLAVAVDAASYAASAVSLALIRAREATPARLSTPASVWSDIAEGLAVVARQPVLRAMAAATALGNFGLFVGMTVYLLFVTDELGFGPALLGTILAVGSVGSLVGAVLVGRLVRRLGIGRSLVAGAALWTAGSYLAPLAGGPPLLAAAVLAAGQAVFGFAFPVLLVNNLSLRQANTPDRLQGRVNATFRVLTWGALPLASLLGGFLGGAIGLRPTMFVGASISLVAATVLFVSPVRGVHSLSTPAGPPAIPS
jgi:predicted MFS family arabinose efflux permease